MNIHRIKQLHRIIERVLFNNDSTLDYMRTLEAITMLSDGVLEYTGDSENLWYMETLHYCDIGSILVGAYWHSIDWQSPNEGTLMKMQISLGRLYTPNMVSGLEPESCEHDVYDSLEIMAQ